MSCTSFTARTGALVSTLFAFIILLSTAAIISADPGPAPSEPTYRPGRPAPVFLEHGPLLGHITPIDARIWAKASGPSAFAVRVGLRSDLADGWITKGPRLEGGDDFMGVTRVLNLKPAQRYYYCVLLNGQPVMQRPYPSFATPLPERLHGNLRFAFGSCVGTEGADSAGTWSDMAVRTNFDLLLMLGDNHYANQVLPEKLRPYFYVQRSLPGYAEIARRVPQYAIWDNHDYSPEPCDRTAKGRDSSLQTFKAFWPNPAYGERDNPGVYFKFTRAGIDFFMTDGRYHRDPNDAPENGSKSMLGEKQLAWLKRELLASKAPVKVIGSGGEWESNGIKNSWASFKRERDDLFQFISEHDITGVLLLSGDRHFTAAYQVAGKFIEVTSGPFGSKNAETKPTSEMFWYSGRGKFYCIYDIDIAGLTPRVVLEIYKSSEGLVERRAFTWEEVSGKAKIKTLSAAAPKIEPAKATNPKAAPPGQK